METWSEGSDLGTGILQAICNSRFGRLYCRGSFVRKLHVSGTKAVTSTHQ